MSYSYEVKKSILNVVNQKCCEKAELYGFFLFSNTFSANKLKVITEHEEVLFRYIYILKNLGIDNFELEKRGQRVVTQILYIDEKKSMEKIIKYLNYCNLTSPLHIDYAVFENECCLNAFLRGAFLSAGVISDPKKTYHIEVKTPHHVLSEDFIKLCSELSLYPKITLRKGNKIIYLKSAESIKDFLSIIGATGMMFDYMNTEIIKNIRNSVNRQINCEGANIEKTINASGKHIKAIEKLKAIGYEFNNMQLQETANLRLKYRDESLEELGKLCNPSISKSGVSHRLNKICEIAKGFEKKSYKNKINIKEL